MPVKIVRWIENKPRGGKQPLPSDDELIVACEEAPLDWLWRGRDVKEFCHMWQAGLALDDIAKAFPDRRNPDDIISLWLHCLYKGWIKDRPGGIYGRKRIRWL